MTLTFTTCNYNHLSPQAMVEEERAGGVSMDESFAKNIMR
jgi:hypothetical protein